MKMIIMGGFLGAGKTSLVLQMARYLAGRNPDKQAKVVILENEIGEVSIDDKIGLEHHGSDGGRVSAPH